MKIFVIEGSTGEYSDHREWLVRAVRTEEAAKADVVGLSRGADLLHAKIEEWDPDYDRYDGEFMESLKAKAGITDPGFRYDYTGTRYTYYAVELEDR